MSYPKYLSEIQRTPPEGYSPTNNIVEVRTLGTFSLPGGRPSALVQLWTSPLAGDDPRWVFMPHAYLVGLHPGSTLPAQRIV
jgi:hypothetical protein